MDCDGPLTATVTRLGDGANTTSQGPRWAHIRNTTPRYACRLACRGTCGVVGLSCNVTTRLMTFMLPVRIGTRTITMFCVDITCSTSYTVVMAKRNLTIQLDEATIRHAKIVAAHRGLSLSSLVAQQLNELAEADQRYERARAVALGALADATGSGAPIWRREELYDL